MSERSRAASRDVFRVMMVGPMITVFALPAWAGPEGQQVVAGSASFARNGAVTTITAANKTIINYTGFNIARHETVRFIQPDASSRVLNRINGSSPTQIDGSLLANGIVYIVNPAGVVFGQGSMVNVGGLHAAAASMTNNDFLRGVDRFTDAQGAVINRGTIVSPEVTLFGRAVENSGSVISPNGVVAFVAGEDLYLGERGGHLYVKIEGAGSEAQSGGVQNLGTIAAPGGKVMVGSGDMFGVMLASSSRIKAKDVEIKGGQGAVTSISGTIDASNVSPGASGGTVDIRGDLVGLFDASIDASGPAGGGKVRIGGDFHGGDGLRASRTYVSESSTIRADATRSGDGGTVVVWSDEVTRFAGNISAQGTGTGNGGLAEVSGKEHLLYTGFTDLRATNGAKGTLLLDPKNIRVQAGGADTLPGNTAFGDASAADRTFSPATIVTALDGADLVLQANNDITIANAIDASANAGNGSLTLQAGRSVLIEADVTLKGSFSATANDTDGALVAAQRDAGAATITMSPGTTIDTSATGGNITLRVLEGGAADTSAATMTVASLDAGAGHVLVRYAGPTADQGIQRADGSATITASSAAFATNGAGGGGFIGTSAQPIQLSVDNLEAVAQRNGAFFTNDQALTVGGATLGGLTGITVTSTAVTGSLGLTASGAIDVTEPISVAGNASIAATDGITLNANVTTNTTIAGTSLVNADSDSNNNTNADPDILTVSNGVTLSSTNSNLTLTLGDLAIGATGAITAGSGDLAISGAAPNHTIGVGGGVAGNDITISATELQQITAANLTIGGSSSGAMQVGTVAAANVGGISDLLTLQTGGSITLQSNAEFRAVAARAADSVIVQGDLSTTVGDLILQGDSDAGGGGTNNVQINANRSFNSAGDLEITATSGLSLSGGAGTEVAFTGDSVMLGNISSGASGVRIQSGGDITTGSISIGAGALTVELDTGNAGAFAAQLGQINAGSVNVAGGSNDNVTFTGSITTSLAAGVDIDGGAITFQDDVNANGSGIVRVTNVGVLAIEDGAPVFAGGGFTQDGTGAVSLGANITTSGDAVSFLRAVTLADTASDLVTIDTTSGGNPAGANITFSSTTNGTVAGAQSLTLNAGTGGDILFTGGVGATTRLGTLTVTNARNVTATLAVQANSVQQVAGTGTTLFSSTLTAIGGGIDLNGTAFTFNGAVNSASSGAFSVTNSGLLTVGASAAITATGGFTQDGAGAVSLGANITTTGDAVSFSGPVTLADTASDLVTIDTTSGPSLAGANVSFGSTLDAATVGGQSLTVNAGTGGDATFTGAVGTTRLGTLTVTNARDFIASSTVSANTIRQVAGQRLTRFDGTVSTTAAGGVELDGAAFTFNDDVTTSGTGIFSITNSGLLTIAEGAPIVAGGVFTQDGAGAVSLGANITTTGDAVSFAGAVTLADTVSDLVTIDTTSGGNPAGANVSFASTLTGTGAGAQSLTVNAGTGGDATFTGAVGATRLGTLTITNARDFIASSTLTAAAVRQVAGQRLTRFDGIVNTNTAAGVDLDGAAFTINDDVSSTSLGIFRVTNAGLLTIADGAPILAAGGFTQDGAGAVSLGANITTNGQPVSFLRAVTLADTSTDIVTINTTNGGATGGANVTFSSTIDATTAAGQSLSINAGTGGDVLFSGAVGAGTRLATLQIANAEDVTASQSITAAVVRQLAGQQLTRFDGLVNTSGAGGVDLTGAAFTFNDDVTATGTGIVRVTNSGLLTIAGGAPVSAAGAFTQDGTGAVSIGSDVTGAGVAFSGASTLTAPVTLTGGAGDVAFGSTLATGGNNLVIVSNGDVSFASNVTGAGATLLIQPTATTTPIDIGTITGGSTAGTLTLSAASASRLDGFSSITIGRDPATSSHAVRVGTSTFNDPLTVRTGSTGSILVRDGGLTGAGDATLTLTGPTTLNAGISNPGRAITINGPATIGQGAAATVSTGAGAGNITITGDITGTTGAAAESLTLTAGTGLIDLQGNLSGVGGAANPAGLTTLTFGSGAGVNVEAITISGALTTVAALTGPFVADGPVSVGSLDMDGTVFTFNAGLTSSGGVSITNSGLLTLLSGLTTNGAIEFTGPALLGGSFASTNNPISLGGATTLASDSEFNAGTSTFTLGASGSIDTDGNALTLTADDMNLASAAGSITSGGDGGALVIQPSSPTRAIALASPSINPSGGFLGLSTAEVATLAGGFDSVAFGRTDGQHEIRVGTLAFSDPVSIRTPLGGSVFIGNGGITGSDNASVTIDGSGATTTLAANIVTDGDDITISDSVLIGANVLLSTGPASAGNITVEGTIDQVATSAAGTFGLTTQAGLGDVDLQGTVGATRAIASLTSTGTDISLSNIGSSANGVTGATSLVATNALTLSGATYRAGSLALQGASIAVQSPATAVISSTGAVDFTGPVTLRDAAGLNVNAATDATFSAAVNGTPGGASESLSVLASNLASLAGPVGSTTPLGSVNVAAGTAQVGPVTTTGTQSIQGSTSVALAGDLTSTTSGSITVTGPTTLASDVEIQTAGAVGDDISIAGSINGSNALVVSAGSGNASLGAVGADTALDALTVSAANIALEAIGAAGEGVSGITSIVGSTSITFNGLVYRANQQTYTAPLKTLASGSTTFFSSNDALTLSGGQTDLTSSSGLSIQSSGGSITTDALVGTAAGQSISIDSGTGTTTLGGVAIRSGGGSGAALVLTGDEIDITGSVAGNTIVLQPSTPNLGITIAAGVTGAPLNLTIAELGFLANGFSQITIGREDNGAHAIVTGPITFRDPVRILTPFGGSVTVNAAMVGNDNASIFIDGPDATTTLNAGITTNGNDITISDAVIVGADVALSTQGGTGLPKGGNILITGPINGANALTLDSGLGSIQLNALVGAVTPLTALTSTGSSITLPGATTTGAQTYNGSTVATGATPAFATGGTAGDDIAFNGTLDGAGSITANAGAGTLTFAGDVGGTTRPSSLAATAALLRFGGSQVRTVGSQDFNGPATTFNPGSGLPGTITLATNGGSGASIDFSSTLDGANNIVLNAGSQPVVLGGLVGGTTPFASFDATGSSISTTGVTTVGNQTYRGPVILPASGTQFATANGGVIQFQQTLNGASDVTLQAPLGQISFGGAVGGTTPLQSIDAEANSIALASTTTSGSQRFAGASTLAGPVTLTTGGTAGANISLASVNGAQNLTLNSGSQGDITLSGPVGGSTPLANFTISNARNVTAGAISAQAISQAAGAGLSTFSGLLSTTAPGGIDLNGNAIRIQGGMNAAGTGPITITNAGELRIAPGTSVQYGGAFTQDGAGDVFLGSNLRNQATPIAFAGPISLTDNVILEGAQVTLNQDVSSFGSARALQIISNGQIALAGAGSRLALASLQITDSGGTAGLTLSGDIVADGLVEIQPPVLLAADSSVTGLGGVTFGSTIDSAPSQNAALTIQTETLVANLPANPELIPVIELGGDIGSTRPLRSLRFNPVERDSVPQIATIAARDSISVNSGELFQMGRNDKFTSVGDMSITADNVILGDLSALGNINVAGSAITILARQGGTVLGPVTPGTDQGVDFVARDQINFSVVPAVDGDGPVFFATETGSGLSSTLSSFSQRAFGSFSNDIFFRGNTVLDLRAQGPTNTNVSEAIAGAAPRESQSGNVRRGTSIGSAQEEQLREIGIDPRGLDVQTLIEALVGRAVYDDLPNMPQYLPGDARITEGRLTQSVVASALQTVAEVLGENESERRLQIRDNLLNAAQAYLDTVDRSRVADGAAFRQFVESSPEHAGAMADLEGLSRLLDQLKLLALTDFELNKAWQQIASSITDRRLPASTLRRAIEAGDSSADPSTDTLPSDVTDDLGADPDEDAPADMEEEAEVEADAGQR
ncbi:MAG: filamentous hemagglutinin N-terminal domain-containing protein [Phycisphaeraceae bacterium]|nr:filamentous hemagglutinin N-terminal domain-containing protein [Phycisphaeraceae bacterium]